MFEFSLNMIDHPLYPKVASYCARAERCPQEVLQWLERKQVPRHECEQILEELVAERYVDEARYIAAFASDKLRFSEQGPMRIKRELLAKDLPENLVESIVDRVMEENNYREVLASLLQKKLALLDSPDADAIQTKVLQWAYGKGFEWEDVLEAARQFLRL